MTFADSNMRQRQLHFAAQTLFFLNAAIWLALTRRRTAIYLLALALLAVNVLLAVTDQFGLLDVLTLLVNVALISLLHARRRAFLAWRGGLS